MSIEQKTLNSYISFAEKLIKKSEKIILTQHKLSISVQYKKDSSPVTKIDKLIESNFRKEIKNKYPTHGIYGEEFKNSKIDNEFIWVIDPIDGTKNFIHGSHAFGTLITLLHYGAPIFGIINSPLMKKNWKGIKGKGAYLNDKKIKKNKSLLGLKEMVISHSGMSAFKEMPENKIYDKIGKLDSLMDMLEKKNTERDGAVGNVREILSDSIKGQILEASTEAVSNAVDKKA